MAFKKVVGTGGIGSGLLFYSHIMDTLGRNESRLVELSNAKDYCKQHIVLHYVAALCKNIADIYPVGLVGSDNIGEQLLKEMRKVGMHTDFVEKKDDESTMISVCLQYPNKDGCNFTSINNAMEAVTPDYIYSCMDHIHVDHETIIAVLPEVPVESRISMLKYGKEKNAFCVLSVPISESDEFLKNHAFQYCDLLAMNEEEASAIIKHHGTPFDVVDELYSFLKTQNDSIALLVTLGSKGGYIAYQDRIEYVPAYPAKVINTTGAGDACLGGVISGLIMGLPFQKKVNDAKFGETPLGSAVELGMLCAGIAVESKDSIAWNVTPQKIRNTIVDNHWSAEKWFIK